MHGTQQQCINACQSDPVCFAFSWPTSSPPQAQSVCYLKATWDPATGEVWAGWRTIQVRGCQGNGLVGDAWSPHKVTAGWEPRYFLTGTYKISEKHGTHKTRAEEMSLSWAAEVTSTVTVGLTASAGFKGIGLEASAEASLSASMRTEIASTYSSEWGSSAEESFEATFDKNSGYLWQWVVKIETNDGAVLTSKTRSMALTKGRWERPLCVPGYGLDMPSYQECFDKDSTLPVIDN